jgi:molybdopterin/thiamine biosynthesis adenylyltransferase
MMRYTITFGEHDYRTLVEHLLGDKTTERAAYLLCGLSSTPEETRLLVREVHPVLDCEVVTASQRHMSIKSISFMRVMKRADRTKQAFVFVHSHPTGVSQHSEQDDKEELKLFQTAYLRIEGDRTHASIVLASENDLRGRVWLRDGSNREIDVVRVIGKRFRFLRPNCGDPKSTLFTRQVQAFGGQLQRELGDLRIGIVGCGGTGSAVAEQLMRLGVGHIYLFDGDKLEKSNVTRVYGAGICDDQRMKVTILEDLGKIIGLGTEITSVPRFITYRSAAEMLRNCDVVFGCTDDEWGRSILTRLAIYYLIPVFDMGVKISSKEGTVESIQGRVTTLMAGSACLFCRGRINSDRISSEIVQASDPDRADSLRKEGYLPELPGATPAVITFTSAIASSAVTELLHRLTGFMGAERASTEVIHLFDHSRVRTNSTQPNPDCGICGNRERWGRGDRQPFLGMTWRAE